MKSRLASAILCGIFCFGVVTLGLIWFYQSGESGFQQVSVEVVFQKEYPDGYQPSLVDLNTATKEELMTLPYVGETIAERIIEYRTLNSGFITVEELLKVNGIGESHFEKMKDYVTLSKRELLQQP